MNIHKTQFFKRWSLGLLILASGVTLNAYSSSGDGNPGEEERSHEEQKGPNGGKLLHANDVELELAIFERGVPPEYRAWITNDGEPIENAELKVTLTRLGGQRDEFTFEKQTDYWRGNGVVTEPHSFDVDVSLDVDGKNHRWQWESHEGRVQIAAEMANNVGISTEIAGPGTIERHLQVFGRLVTPPNQKAALRARFAGVITDVRVNVGDSVDKGDVLATIESNESLQRYTLRAPIAGVIQERSVNVGELATDFTLFTIVDSKTLWAELKVFPGQRAQVKPGQNVHILHNNHAHESRVTHVTSTGGGSPFVLARVELPNEGGELSPGDLVVARIDVEKVEGSLVVDRRALQDFRDWTVAFIKVGDTYEIRPLELGVSDERYTQVLAGLEAGDYYVVQNSYLIKADIEKSGASHDH